MFNMWNNQLDQPRMAHFGEALRMFETGRARQRAVKSNARAFESCGLGTLAEAMLVAKACRRQAADKATEWIV